MAGSHNRSVPGTVGDSSGITALGLEEPRTGIGRSCFPSQKHPLHPRLSSSHPAGNRPTPLPKAGLLESVPM